MIDRKCGFTLVEIIIVLVLVGIILGVVVPRVENLSPKYALRSAARRIAAELEHVRSTSIIQRETYAICYDFARRRYFVILPPPLGDPELPLEYWPRAEPTELPSLVRFYGVVLADNSVHEARSVDHVTVLVDPLGTSGSHVAVLEDEAGRTLSVKFNALTGTVEFSEDIAGFARYD